MSRFVDRKSDDIEKLRFLNACEKSSNKASSIRSGGIGTLREKALHSTIKYFIEPDANKHEVRIGQGIADVLNDEGIFEVQTKGFDRLRKKLETFLSEYVVTVVLPIPATKYLISIDKNTGEMTKPRKSPRRGNIFEAFVEFYRLGELICRENLRLLVLLIDMDEYRLTGRCKGNRKGWERFERLPRELKGIVPLYTAEDYLAILPKELSAEFTSADIARAANISIDRAGTVLRVLSRLGLVSVVGKKSRYKLYTITRQSC